jgi:hypothetical protein
LIIDAADALLLVGLLFLLLSLLLLLRLLFLLLGSSTRVVCQSC